MTRRRETAIRLAEALGLAPAEGESTSELMDRCIERAEGLQGIEPLEAVEARPRAESQEGEAKPGKAAKARPRRRRTEARAA